MAGVSYGCGAVCHPAFGAFPGIGSPGHRGSTGEAGSSPLEAVKMVCPISGALVSGQPGIRKLETLVPKGPALFYGRKNEQIPKFCSISLTGLGKYATIAPIQNHFL